MKRKFNDAQTKLIKAKQEMITIKANNDRTEAEKRDLMSVIDKKTAEIESSNGNYFVESKLTKYQIVSFIFLISSILMSIYMFFYIKY